MQLTSISFKIRSAIKMLSLYKVYIMACVCVTLENNYIEGVLTCYKRPPEVALHKCCPLPHFYTKAIKQKCNSNEDHFKIETEYQHYCFISCAVEEIGLLKNDTFFEPNLVIYLEQVLQPTPDLSYTVKDAFHFCFNKYESMSRIIITNGPCAFYHVLIMDCVIDRIFKNCPDFLWLNTTDCNEAWNYWQNCLSN